MGIGGCQNGNWAWWFMGNCSQWLPVFLNRSNHQDKGIPMDYVSIHYYASASNRSDVGSYTRGIFGSADDWLTAMDENLEMRARLAPEVKIGMTELGTLMVDDMSHTFGKDGGLPDLYFNTAGAFYAYIFGHMAVKGLDFLCFSQLIGSPPIPEWNIHDMQFPSASMLSWETGLGNAKYWVLKLLIDNLRKGDTMYEAQVSPVQPPRKPHQVMCEHVGHWNFFGSVTLTCEDPGAVIEEIWADYGEPPTGACGEYQASKACSSHVLTSMWAGWKCKGKEQLHAQERRPHRHDGVLPPQDDRGQGGPAQRHAHGAGPLQRRAGRPHVLGLPGRLRLRPGLRAAGRRAAKDGKQLYLVNKEAEAVEVSLDAAAFGAGEILVRIVDPQSAQRSSAQGIRSERWARAADGSLKVTLQPYAVVIAEEVLAPQEAITLI
eukprot:SRR837773.3961.p1 GENE.SRR837773.3961~~SRR837773.3961.p1  ORF type:complete len:497 (+),score=200.70 SRR837773.3961:194-1492(+)